MLRKCRLPVLSSNFRIIFRMFCCAAVVLLKNNEFRSVLMQYLRRHIYCDTFGVHGGACMAFLDEISSLIFRLEWIRSKSWPKFRRILTSKCTPFFFFCTFSIECSTNNKRWGKSWYHVHTCLILYTFSFILYCK